ncbi:hypothetical protein J1N35_039809 [Gossypium stocksii]|uniref:Reverse transcriptase domain-containing protein n=1 Tax=Gossypium stocksii TaxID=47602 RepID=A0A9D3ZHR4_9ROSI|nr:hypothetical protein J1N35_039809 [Gossypium stocksii]
MCLKLGKLLDKDEKYWAQRSGVTWLKEGDRNTRFFHVRATNRKKKNNIARLKDVNGHWRENTTDICKAIREVVYKIVAKVLANRLKDTLPLCISQNQSAFVPGRMIHDNILIAHELVHYLQSAKNRPNKGFVIKLDMSKAYDRVEWPFIEEVMKKMGSQMSR